MSLIKSLTEHREGIAHFTLLLAGVLLVIVGVHFSNEALSRLGQYGEVGWAVVVPGAACVLAGAMVLCGMARSRAGHG